MFNSAVKRPLTLRLACYFDQKSYTRVRNQEQADMSENKGNYMYNIVCQIHVLRPLLVFASYFSGSITPKSVKEGVVTCSLGVQHREEVQ